jgi:hypothetical protein
MTLSAAIASAREHHPPFALAGARGLTSSTVPSLFFVPVVFLFFAQEGEALRDEPELLARGVASMPVLSHSGSGSR